MIKNVRNPDLCLVVDLAVVELVDVELVVVELVVDLMVDC